MHFEFSVNRGQAMPLLAFLFIACGSGSNGNTTGTPYPDYATPDCSGTGNCTGSASSGQGAGASISTGGSGATGGDGVGSGGSGMGSGGAPPVTPQGVFDWRDAVIYFAFIDRFLDGDPSNNCNVPGSQESTTTSTNYLGGDWAGVTQKINSGY
ncbi:MAG TPA: hypothetical protein VNW92_09330, partial [Polyangiaceae bacterium]|nr:hypothetical protein [Polyangiaceae bacterium]